MSEKRIKRNKLDQLDMEKLVYGWLMDGWSPRLIIDELMANHEYRSESNCRKIIDKVIKSFAPEKEKDIKMLQDKYIEMYNNLYKRAIENGETITAKNIMDSMVKLQGLAITKVEAKIENTFDVTF